MQLWKEVLLPGRQRDRFGNWFTVKPQDVRRAAANVAKMLSRGVPLPTVWEHQDVEAGDAAEHRARYAKHTFGHVAGHRLNDRGALELLHDVPDPRDADQLLKTRFVSPKLYRGYSDSQGGTYRGATIAHVAATPTPIQFWQRPFSRTMSRGKAFYFSYTPGDRPMADEKDDDKGGKTNDQPKPGAGKSTLADVIAALKEKGWNIPDEVQDEAGLVIAIKAGDGMGDPDDLDAELNDAAPPADSQPAPGGAPMLMSDGQAEPFRKMARRDLENRTKALFTTGRIDRPTAKRLLGEVKAVQLSFTRGGEIVSNRTLAKIEAFEELPKGVVWSKTGQRRADATDLSDTRAEPEPNQMLGRGNVDNKIVDFMCAGLPAKK